VKRVEHRNNVRVCFNCRQPGHDLSTCPKVEKDVEQGTGICFKCGSTEHSLAQCRAHVPQDSRMPSVSSVKKLDICLGHVLIILGVFIQMEAVAEFVNQLNILRRTVLSYRNSKEYRTLLYRRWTSLRALMMTKLCQFRRRKRLLQKSSQKSYNFEGDNAKTEALSLTLR